MARSAALSAPLPVLELPGSLVKSLASGHPWVYRDHVPHGFSAPPGFVRVVSGTFSAIALWDPDSPLACRIYSRTEVPDERFFFSRVRAAYELRETLGVTEHASAYRLLNGEGDGLPGVIVDRYGTFAVLSLDTDALQSFLPSIAGAVKSLRDVQGVVRRHKEDGETRLEPLAGRLPPKELVVEEYGVRLLANLHEGQKTGLFLDQRENRRWVGEHAAGRTLLNLFGYTGGFSVHAALAGATHVTTVDVAERALQDARRNFELNGLEPKAHDFRTEDVFEFLRVAREKNERWDVVVCDPPSFARSRAQRDRAVESYTKLHAMGLAVTAPGGLYAASSCTTQVSVEAFHGAIAAAARKAGVRFQIVEDAGHPPDHPILEGHPEGRYLKFVVGRVTKL